MIESNLSFDLLPDADLKAYGEWVQTTVASIAKQPGMVEFRANRNFLGAPQIRSSTIWQSLEDWSRFTEGNVWQSTLAELHRFAGNVKVELWGPSPVVPDPVRPTK